MAKVTLTLDEKLASKDSAVRATAKTEVLAGLTKGVPDAKTGYPHCWEYSGIRIQSVHNLTDKQREALLSGVFDG